MKKNGIQRSIKGSLEINDPGVLRDSQIYFPKPSLFAKTALFCITAAGDFFCDTDYWVQRDYLEATLLLYIESGELELEYNNRKHILGSGNMVIIDGRHPHYYKADSNIHMWWAHLEGESSFAYQKLLAQLRGVLWDISKLPEISFYIKKMVNYSSLLPNREKEHDISILIHSMYGGLYKSTLYVKTVTETAIDEVVTYLEENYQKDIFLDDMAQIAALSRYHFVRRFKEYKGITPHEYLVNIRIQQSKKLLYSSDYSLEKIAELCGFSDVSYFIRVFKKHELITPNQFRNLKF